MLSRPTDDTGDILPVLSPADLLSGISAVAAGLQDHMYVSSLGIGQELVVPVLYGICYSVEKAATPTFSVTQILALVTGGSATSGVLAAEWNQRFVIPSVGFVNVVVGS